MTEYRYCQPGNVPVVKKSTHADGDITYVTMGGQSWPPATSGNYSSDGAQEFCFTPAGKFFGGEEDWYLTTDPITEQPDIEVAIQTLRDAGYTVTEPPEDLSEAAGLLADMIAAVGGGYDATVEAIRQQKIESTAWSKWELGIELLHDRLKDIRASVR